MFGATAERCVSGEAEAATTGERAAVEAVEEALAQREPTRRADGRRAAAVPDGRLRALLGRLVKPTIARLLSSADRKVVAHKKVVLVSAVTAERRPCRFVEPSTYSLCFGSCATPDPPEPHVLRQPQPAQGGQQGQVLRHRLLHLVRQPRGLRGGSPKWAHVRGSPPIRAMSCLACHASWQLDLSRARHMHGACTR